MGGFFCVHGWVQIFFLPSTAIQCSLQESIWYLCFMLYLLSFSFFFFLFLFLSFLYYHSMQCDPFALCYTALSYSLLLFPGFFSKQESTQVDLAQLSQFLPFCSCSSKSVFNHSDPIPKILHRRLGKTAHTSKFLPHLYRLLIRYVVLEVFIHHISSYSYFIATHKTQISFSFFLMCSSFSGMCSSFSLLYLFCVCWKPRVGWKLESDRIIKKQYTPLLPIRTQTDLYYRI